MFFKDWIKLDQKTTINNYQIRKFTEIPDSRKNIYEELIERVIGHYTNPKRIKKYLKDEKYAKLEDYIHRRIPTTANSRKGDFGEIFGTEHLKQFHGYKFPLTKLMIKLKLNRPLEGEDILGFYIENNEITKICIGESKIRTNSDSNVLNDAIDQLKKSYKPHPVLLRYFSDHVYEFDEELGEKIEDLMSPNILNNVEKFNCIFYITSFKPRTFNIDSSSNELDNLILINVHFDDLNEFITTLFEDCRSFYHEE